MKAREYRVMEHAVESGARHGVSRWYKHCDDGPDEHERDEMADAIAQQVLAAIGEWFTFDEREEV